MMIHMAWVFLSFFAVVGILVCFLEALELLSLRRIRSVQKTVFQVVLSGDEKNVEYLLNTLSVKLDFLHMGSVEPILEIVDGGLSPESCRAVAEYCEKNPWVLFTVCQENDII